MKTQPDTVHLMPSESLETELSNRAFKQYRIHPATTRIREVMAG